MKDIEIKPGALRMSSIVVISPSSRLTNLFEDILRVRSLPLVLAQASQTTAVGIASELLKEETSVIISRGKTAEILRKHFQIPIVEVRHTFFDCYNAYNEARNISDKIVFLATSDSYKEMLNKSKPFLNNVEICVISPFDSLEKSEGILDELKRRGFEVAIGGLSLRGSVIARGFHYVMSNADADAINDAIDEALHLKKIEDTRREQSIELHRRFEMIDSILNCVSEGIFSVSLDGTITNINSLAKDYLSPLTLGDKLSKEFMEMYFTVVFKNGDPVHGVLVNISQHQLTLSIVPINFNAQTVGAVATLQKQHEIRILEGKMRRELALSHKADKNFTNIIGKSSAILSAKQLAEKYALVDSTVMIEGETGTGKELFAQSIHNASKRKHAPFVAINCAAFASGVLESELFGYVKGAFTGASSEGKAGVFELAHTGTIFLDEISEVSKEIQIKLLRTLQERKVMRMGDNKVTPVDIRIITATNKNLFQLVAQGEFREDFYYRVCVLPLLLPPLRHRREDIAELVNHLIKLNHSDSFSLSDAALSYLSLKEWRGNIRQLSNIIERIAILADEEVVPVEVIETAFDAGAYASILRDDVVTSLSFSKKDEKQIIFDALSQAKGNKKLAAKLLGVSTTTLWRRMTKFTKDDLTFFDTAKYLNIKKV